MTDFRHDESGDIRARRTRGALFEAFASLVMDKRYEEISVQDIIGAAGIARSTFYQHFANKDAILVESLTPLLGILAQGACGQANARKQVKMVLEHFWDRRHLAIRILRGTPYQLIVTALARELTMRLPTTDQIPRSLETLHRANATLGLISAWLTRPDGCSAAELTEYIMTDASRHARAS